MSGSLFRDYVLVISLKTRLNKVFWESHCWKYNSSYLNTKLLYVTQYRREASLHFRVGSQRSVDKVVPDWFLSFSGSDGSIQSYHIFLVTKKSWHSKTTLLMCLHDVTFHCYSHWRNHVLFNIVRLSNVLLFTFIAPQGFRPEGKVPRRHSSNSRILRKVLTIEIYSHTVNIEKISISLNRGRTGAARNR